MNKLIFFGFMFLAGCSSNKYVNPHILIDTQFGDIELELYPDKAPQTVHAFINNIEAGHYAGSAFYRVLKEEDLPSNVNVGLIQGGVYKSKKSLQLQGTPHETTNRSGLSHTDGTVSMARTDPGTATTEFFICIGDQSPLDSGRRGTPDGLGMAAFGKVFKGMDVVRKIQAQANNGDAFVNDITIKSIKNL